MKNKNSKGFARSVGVRLFAAALGSVALGGATLGCGDEDTAADDENDTLTDVVKDTDSDTLDCAGVSDITVDILEREIELEGQTVTKKVNTVLMVNWEQVAAADTVKLRFSFENDEWFESPSEPGALGAHEIPVLGVPELTDVAIQIVSETDGDETVCETAGATLEVPKSIPRPTVRAFDPSLASSNRWMLGAVEKTPEILGMYEGIFTVYIIDRQGRIVWYYLDQAWSPVTAYPRIARDGKYFYFDRSTYLGAETDNQPSIARTTLDFRQFEQIKAPSMTDSMDITDDGSFVYNSEEWLIELKADGTERKVWNCTEWAQNAGFDLESIIDIFKEKGKEDFIKYLSELGKEKMGKILYGHLCYANSVVWNPLEDAILLSFPYTNTVVEVSRKSGEVIGQWGDAAGSWQFEPASIGFEFEHGANITPEGTLLVSTRATGIEDPLVHKPPHYFIEFELDRDNQIAKEIWRFGEGLTDWPACKGEAFPVSGGNRLVNYGAAGIIREITPDLEIAWDVKWDADFEVPPELKKKYSEEYTGDDINNMVGHDILIDDLYALNSGWESK
jgi:hypothetical protein